MAIQIVEAPELKMIRLSSKLLRTKILLKRLFWPAMGWAALGVGGSLFARPDRAGILFSGGYEAWRLVMVGIGIIFLGYCAAALSEKSDKKKLD